MDKTYQPQPIEAEATRLWENLKAFAPSNHGTPYCIMLPPPNVTGSLHMGHGFQQTLMDILTRYHRMKGYNTLWQPGTDHAGIATQMVVERQLISEGKTRHDLGRESFLKRVWDWKAESGGTIVGQMRRLGTSADWDKERFTMDEGLSFAVKQSFIELYRKGLIYRGKRLVNWDTHLHTAVSDLEVLTEEQMGHLWHIHYPLADGSQGVIVATTRPETLLGDVAVAVHPEDERYQGLIGQFVSLPLCNRLIPIIADSFVEREFGTGCVKITPAHDFNDYAVGEKHKLPLINILTIDGKMNASTPLAYQGLDRFVARAKIVADLSAQGLMVKIEDYKRQTPIGERSGTILEPFLTDQWFVKTKPLAEPAIKAVQDGRIRFIPDNAKNLYFEWMNNIQDWCISRQLWWGHRIPAWYDEQGQIYVGEDEESVRAYYHLSTTHALKQDEDVLDTWFSSALWPFSTLGWPEDTSLLKTFYPTSVLVTGFDIIFFWVARMIMFGLQFMGEVPFKDVYVHGLIRDHEGQKMSKSKGNVLDPVDLIDGINLDDLLKKRISNMMQPRLAEKIQKATKAEFPDGIAAFGADALRFTFCALATSSRDICFDISRMAGYRNFCNKLWNAARFVLMQVEQNSSLLQVPCNNPVHQVDRYIWSRFHLLLQTIEQAIQDYRFDWLAQALYEFVWNEFCDWSLEFSKIILSHESFSQEEKAGTLWTITHMLESILQVLHPIIPFITESIWQQFQPEETRETKTIAQTSFPIYIEKMVDTQAIEEIEQFKIWVTALRTLRSEMNINPQRYMSLIIENATPQQRNLIQSLQSFFKALCKVEHLEFMSPGYILPASAPCILEQITFHIPLAGLINLEEEQARLYKQVLILEKDVARAETKLNNPNFVQNAPQIVIDQEHQKLSAAQHSLTKLSEQLKSIEKDLGRTL